MPPPLIPSRPPSRPARWRNALAALGLSPPASEPAAVAAVARGPAGPPYEALVEALPDPVLVIAAPSREVTRHRYILANAAARDLLRLEGGEGLLLAAVRDPGVLAAIEAAIDGAEGESLYETGGGAPQSLRARTRLLGQSAEGDSLVMLAFRDETDMRQVERTRVDFLANASHELRTPLASLSGFIETLLGHARDDAGARDKFLGIMLAQAQRMSRLIDDLLVLSRIELNEHVPPADALDLGLVAGEVIEAAAPLAQARQVTIDAVLPPRGAAPIRGDRDQVVQVIQNLLENALKYSPDGGQVRVCVKTAIPVAQWAGADRAAGGRFSLVAPDIDAGQLVSVSVRDAGPGIARENLPRLTERFYRVEGQKSGERSGTGLGLAIVKHIVNRHGGGLAVDSAPGEGSTFTAAFPMMTAVGPPVAKAS